MGHHQSHHQHFIDRRLIKNQVFCSPSRDTAICWDSFFHWWPGITCYLFFLYLFKLRLEQMFWIKGFDQTRVDNAVRKFLLLNLTACWERRGCLFRWWDLLSSLRSIFSSDKKLRILTEIFDWGMSRMLFIEAVGAYQDNTPILSQLDAQHVENILKFSFPGRVIEAVKVLIFQKFCLSPDLSVLTLSVLLFSQISWRLQFLILAIPWHDYFFQISSF